MRSLPVLEFYGLPGVGKSTIAEALGRLLHDGGLRVGTRELLSQWIARMPRREKLGFRLAAALRVLQHPAVLWAYCTRVRPLQLRRFFLLFMKAEAMARIRRRDSYDVLVLDQWLLQDLWSLFVHVRSAPADLPARLWAVTADAPLMCHVSAPVGEVAARLSSRAHGLSRLDGLDLETSLSRLAELEGFTRHLLDSAAGQGELIEVDGRVEVQDNARRLAARFLPGAEGKREVDR